MDYSTRQFSVADGCSAKVNMRIPNQSINQVLFDNAIFDLTLWWFCVQYPVSGPHLNSVGPVRQKYAPLSILEAESGSIRCKQGDGMCPFAYIFLPYMHPCHPVFCPFFVSISCSFRNPCSCDFGDDRQPKTGHPNRKCLGCISLKVWQLTTDRLADQCKIGVSQGRNVHAWCCW